MCDWVSVGERLPDDGICAICYYSSHEGKPVVADCFAVYTEGKWYWWVDGYGDEVEFTVTHWAILVPPAD